MTGARDPRVTPARPDVAAAHLRGRVEAARFAEGRPMQTTAGVAAMRAAPEGDATMVSQLLFGETFTVYDEADGWGWGQAAHDDYVGYVDMEALSAPVDAATLTVAALRTYVFAEPNVKAAPRFLISSGALTPTAESQGGFVRAPRAGWVWRGHLRPVEAVEADFVAVAERYLGAPYLWGGRESLGCDCSGLVQVALAAAGVAAPRDSDMQEALGAPAPVEGLEGLARGDLVFWRGHVGIMLDARRLLHANAHHMAVAIEPLAEAASRIAGVAGPITAVRRLPRPAKE